MHLSETPTSHILVRANTNSEWDFCDFAIIHLSDKWKECQIKRLQAVEPFKDDNDFRSLNYYDEYINFCQLTEEEVQVDELLAEKEWAFVELDEEELKELTPPENRLDCYRLVIYNNGDAKYTAYGKHTNEEFWTNKISLLQIIEKL